MVSKVMLAVQACRSGVAAQLLIGVLLVTSATTAIAATNGPARAAEAGSLVPSAPVRAAGATPAPRAPLRIMPLGDSITSGVGSRTRSSYRADLYARLSRAGLAVDFVGSQRSGVGPDTDHEGHGGWTIDRIAGRVNGWLAASRPDVVLLHVGTNNVTLGESPAAIAAKLSALIDRIRAARPSAHLFVSQIIGSKVRAELAVDRRYNALIPAVVAAKGPMVRLVDQSGVNGIDLLDLHHPNDFGYAKMAYTFYAALQPAFNTSPHPWPAGVNPHRQRAGHRCLWRPVVRHGRTVGVTECRVWTLRTVPLRVDGVLRRVERWQTQRRVTQTYRTVVDGRRVTRTRRVLVWVGPGAFLRF